MKIMHIGQMIGGLEVYLRNTVTCLSDDFEFVIVHGDEDGSKPVVANGTRVREYEVSLYRSLNPLKDLKCLVQVVRIIRKEKPDLIHCHSAKGGVIGRIAGWLTGTTTLYTPHAFSFLSTPSTMKRCIYLTLERMVRFNSYLLACSESERQLGIEEVGYNKDRALVWSNSVPDAAKMI